MENKQVLVIKEDGTPVDLDDIGILMPWRTGPESPRNLAIFYSSPEDYRQRGDESKQILDKIFGATRQPECRFCGDTLGMKYQALEHLRDEYLAASHNSDFNAMMLAELRNKMFPVGSFVDVNCSRYKGPGIVVNAPECSPTSLPVRLQNGNTWFYPMLDCCPRIEPLGREFDKQIEDVKGRKP